MLAGNTSRRNCGCCVVLTVIGYLVKLLCHFDGHMCWLQILAATSDVQERHVGPVSWWYVAMVFFWKACVVDAVSRHCKGRVAIWKERADSGRMSAKIS